MKATMLLLVLGICLTSVGCRGSAEATKAYLDERDNLLVQISKTLEANPSEAGVDEARKMFEAKKGDLKAKYEATKQESGGSESTRMIVEAGSTRNNILLEIRKNFSASCEKAHSFKRCEAAITKLSALGDEIRGV
jgi:hypothetical protein